MPKRKREGTHGRQPKGQRYSRASGSTTDRCVWFFRFSPRKFTVGLPASSSSEPSLTLSTPLSFGLRLFNDA